MTYWLFANYLPIICRKYNSPNWNKHPMIRYWIYWFPVFLTVELGAMIPRIGRSVSSPPWHQSSQLEYSSAEVEQLIQGPSGAAVEKFKKQCFLYVWRFRVCQQLRLCWAEWFQGLQWLGWAPPCGALGPLAILWVSVTALGRLLDWIQK